MSDTIDLIKSHRRAKWNNEILKNLDINKRTDDLDKKVLVRRILNGQSTPEDVTLSIIDDRNIQVLKDNTSLIDYTNKIRNNLKLLNINEEGLVSLLVLMSMNIQRGIKYDNRNIEDTIHILTR